jgi:transketolase
MDDLKQFRQWGSRTPGHPELERDHPIPGIEITTGPLGQGVGNAIGMALAEAMLAERYNRDDSGLVDHRTYAICSDGDVMEGVSGEASSIAGFLGLGKLCLIYDDNHITIEGSTGLAFGGTSARYGPTASTCSAWRQLDDRRPARALDAAEAEARPSLIIVRTHIAIGARGCPGHAKATALPLGGEEVRLTKQVYGWDPDKHFVPDESTPTSPARARGGQHAAWNAGTPAEGHGRGARPRALGREPLGLGGCAARFSGAGAQATRQSSGSASTPRGG